MRNPSTFERNWTRCPLVLTATHRTAGLGYAFMSFNRIINTAMKNAMVANSTFPNRFSHDLMSSKVEQIFCGPLFRAQNPVTTTCDTTLRVESWEDTEMVILQAKKTCQRNHTVCVDIDTEFPADDGYFDT